MHETLDAGEICSRIVTIAPREMAIDDAAGLMRAHHVGCLVVVDDGPAGRRPLGILTDRDIVTAVVARRIDAGRVTVGDVMVTTLHTARSSDSMMDLMRLMRAKGVRRLPVLGPEGELVGLVTLDDVLDVLAQQLALLASTIEAGRDRERRQRR